MTSVPITGDSDARSDSHVCTAVIDAVAQASGVDATELPPLYEWVDPDALEALFAPTVTGGTRRGRIEFEYCGYAVSVVCDGDVSVEIGGEFA